MIGTVHTSQPALLDAISQLYNGGQAFHADLTFGKGGFWRQATHLAPTVRMRYQSDDCHGASVVADVRALPFRKGSLRSIVFDPPFLHAPGKDSIMGQQFGGYPSQAALWALYADAATQIHAALAHRGLLVWKCQDVIESGRQVRTSQAVWRSCKELLLDDLDKFVLVRKSRMVGWNQHAQQHARKQESYFWVFRKP